MKKKNKNNSGITLMVLIVMIVIMLILLGVGTKVIIDGKIFTQAEKSVNGTNEKIAQEQASVDELTGELNKVIQSQCEHIWSEWQVTGNCTDGGTEKRVCSKCDKVETKVFGTEHRFEGGEIEGTKYVRTCGRCGEESKIDMIGLNIDYHEYMDETGKPFSTMPKYVSKKAQTGHTEDQTFTVTNNSGIQWQILGIEDNQIKIITKEVFGPTTGGVEDNGIKYYTIKGKDGYVNYVNELNKIGSIYGHGKYADTDKFSISGIGTSGGRSINSGDMNSSSLQRTPWYTLAMEKHEGDDVAKVYRYAAGTTPDGTSTEGGKQTKIEYMELDATTSIEEEKHNWKELSTEGEQVTLYQYTNGIGSYLMNKFSTNIKYFVATRYLNWHVGGLQFHLRVVSEKNVSHTRYWMGADNINNTNTHSYCVRPIVYLKENVNIQYNETENSFELK